MVRAVLRTKVVKLEGLRSCPTTCARFRRYGDLTFVLILPTLVEAGTSMIFSTALRHGCEGDLASYGRFPESPQVQSFKAHVLLSDETTSVVET